MARKKLSEDELEARQELLSNETITDRTKRVLNPRINKLRKQIHVLTKAFDSPRYELTNDQQVELEETLDDDMTNLFKAINGSTSEDVIEDIL